MKKPKNHFEEILDDIVWRLTGRIKCFYCGKYYLPLLDSKDNDKMLLIKMSFCSRNCELSDFEMNQQIDDFLKEHKFTR